MISTRLTKMLDIRHPVVQAGIGGVARAELVAAVCNAGGLGILGMNRMSPDFIREQIRKTRALTSRPFGVNAIPPVAPPPGGFEVSSRSASRSACPCCRSSGVTQRHSWSDAMPPESS